MFVDGSPEVLQCQGVRPKDYDRKVNASLADEDWVDREVTRT
jgi:hypothetical protein